MNARPLPVIPVGWMGLDHSHTTNKAQAYRLHALRRAYERYGWELTEDEFNGAVRAILTQDPSEARWMEVLTKSRTLYLVLLRGVWAPAIYSKSRHTIVTFLPAEAIKSGRMTHNHTPIEV